MGRAPYFIVVVMVLVEVVLVGVVPSWVLAQEGYRLELTQRDSFLASDNHVASSSNRLKTAVSFSLARMHSLLASATGNFTTLSATRASSSAPVYKASGTYVVTLSLGSPPQPFAAIFDTGSDLVWRQSEPCKECFNESKSARDHVFHPSDSSTYKPVPCSDQICLASSFQCTNDGSSNCNYTYGYGDGTTTLGVLSYDTLTIGVRSSKVEKFAFGAGNDDTGDIPSLEGISGIVGMGGGVLSLPSQMESKFSYCLVRWSDGASKISPLLLGSRATIKGNKNVQSTPFVNGSQVPVSTFYYLSLQGLSVGHTRLDIPAGTFDIKPDGSGGLIIDSGTPYLILSTFAYTPLRSAYVSAINLPTVDGKGAVGFDLCYQSSKINDTTIPPLVFHFDGADLRLPTENTFVDVEGFFCLAALPAPPQDFNIYGSYAQQNFQFVYDKGPKNKLSFKPVDCETL